MEKLIVKKYALSLILIFITIGTAHAEIVSGFFKTYPVLMDTESFKEARQSQQDSVKIQLNYDLPAETKFEASYLISRITERPLPHKKTDPNYRFDDLNLYLHDEAPANHSKSTFTQNLNRLNLNFKADWGDILVGRQAVSFGSTKSISPTDVLTPLAPNTIDKEERIGIDSLILKIPFNESVLTDFGIVAGKNFEDEKNAYYVRPKLTYKQLDLTGTLMRFQDKNLIGFELQHPINDAGFWFDYAYVDQDVPRLNDFSRFTTGIDYKFQNSLYLAFEYHYSGLEQGKRIIAPFDFIYLSSQHYYILTSSYEITPLLVVNLQNFFSPHDNSELNALKFDYNLTENSYLGLGTYVGLGNQTTSEFGRYAKIYYGSFRYYF